jgi:hypothetical protein
MADIKHGFQPAIDNSLEDASMTRSIRTENPPATSREEDKHVRMNQ